MLSRLNLQPYYGSVKTREIIQLALCCGLAACATSRQPAVERDDASPYRGAVVVRGQDLGGDILAAIQTRIPAAQILRDGTCPRIMFRGQRSRTLGPSVYIDGTRMVDTCSLSDVSPSDVDFIEVYPSGNTTRPGIERNGYGLILIFRRRE